MTAKKTVFWTDRVIFEVRGEGTRRFLSLAAGAGVLLSGLRCTEKGYSGKAMGRDVSRLYRVAGQTGVELIVRGRYGPGKWLENLRNRPGLLAGAAVFFLLQWYLSGFVWTIDFGEMEPERQICFRQALAEQEIWEGCRIGEEKLRLAEEALELETQDVGWLSLNFTGGCLFVEENEREIQEIRQETQPQALYAKTGGQILSIELESGFVEAAVGQYVAAGRLLANGQKSDRKGQAVVQGAAGCILGRIQKSYTAQQPLEADIQMLTGTEKTEEILYFMGHSWNKETPDNTSGTYAVTEWIPLRVGRVALPGCLCRTTYWERERQTETYTEKTAEHMAARTCRKLLLQEFPDAELETETLHFETAGKTVICRADFVFRADMAQPGPLAPIEGMQSTS